MSVNIKEQPREDEAHQLAAVHRVVMDHMAFVPSQYDIAAQAKRLRGG